jgi:hypothetical protein
MFKLTDFTVERAGKDYAVFLATREMNGPLATLPTIEECARFIRALVDERL